MINFFKAYVFCFCIAIALLVGKEIQLSIKRNAPCDLPYEAVEGFKIGCLFIPPKENGRRIKWNNNKLDKATDGFSNIYHFHDSHSYQYDEDHQKEFVGYADHDKNKNKKYHEKYWVDKYLYVIDDILVALEVTDNMHYSDKAPFRKFYEDQRKIVKNLKEKFGDFDESDAKYFLSHREFLVQKIEETVYEDKRHVAELIETLNPKSSILEAVVMEMYYDRAIRVSTRTYITKGFKEKFYQLKKKDK